MVPSDQAEVVRAACAALREQCACCAGRSYRSTRAPCMPRGAGKRVWGQRVEGSDGQRRNGIEFGGDLLSGVEGAAKSSVRAWSSC